MEAIGKIWKTNWNKKQQAVFGQQNEDFYDWTNKNDELLVNSAIPMQTVLRGLDAADK